MSCLSDFDDSFQVPAFYSAYVGNFQSPIDIKCEEMVTRQFPPFKFSSAHLYDIMFTLKNDGHGVKAVLPKAYTSQYQTDLSVTGGGLIGKFNFDNFHLHWGTNYRDGSEHTINGQSFAAEAHLVYKNLETQEIAVFALFFHIVHSVYEENSEWKKYTHLGSSLTEGNAMNCTFNLSQLTQIKSRNFVRYMGSLTTPPYTEGIIWTVFLDAIPILDTNLNLLRYNVMRKTDREVQPINGRIIYVNYDNEPRSYMND
ncbi:unnamed protein product [Rotaria sp. Silwood1]|nr:unnamed protein product [Rotaria sp. Silwood1]CAF3652607.1 unnamed protein product [Rotaria sp. Silwood1]